MLSGRATCHKTNTAGTYHLAGSAEDIDALKGYAIGRLDVQRNALDVMRDLMAWAKEAQPAMVVAAAVPTHAPSRAPSIGHGLGM
ncbi:hypothetical protein RHOFW510R12_05215 [Rhodanobacter sp. FW510-R12]|uniref:hypothetical protein n=1 Tax=unclassified Rhodanobacter TaxID=2621553 RepID=UPI0007AA2C09|nr:MULTISPECIES: hypothetical protein [unclassified Rhodanobacter]KZC18129.1 hypothetical protein RHOFW104R8_07645 [Rhodanobacter sp. FW104-R8]KZC25801.1 hypothetical protein RhoFW510T8_05680 [Rhodanobacter sp. FW510-T8]KZC33564.1 hypothetical protein RhoFW510R10_07575 [Rhodanobacter sp. FW510-R10]